MLELSVVVAQLLCSNTQVTYPRRTPQPYSDPLSDDLYKEMAARLDLDNVDLTQGIFE